MMGLQRLRAVRGCVTDRTDADADPPQSTFGLTGTSRIGSSCLFLGRVGGVTVQYSRVL